MKLIKYEGGIVSFKLPDDWKEEYYGDDGAAFYRKDSDSGTLHLNIIPFDKTVATKNSAGLELFSDSDSHVQEGFSMKEETKLSEEDGDPTLTYFWYVNVPICEAEHRLIVFSYTILASQEKDLLINDELNFVRNTILTAHYAQ